MNNENNRFFFWLSVLANILQIENYEMLLNDANNNDLMRHLQKQDEVLDNQTHGYLDKILKQNNEILKILNERK